MVFNFIINENIIYLNYYPKTYEYPLVFNGFDLDYTLIKTKSGNIYPKNKDDFTFMFENVIEKLNDYISKKYIIFIISNQNGLLKSKNKVKLENMIFKLNFIFKNILNKIINTEEIIKSNNYNNEEKDEVCFNIYETFDIPILNKNIIVSGKLISGKIEINKEYFLNNSIIKVINIHNKNIDTDILLTGETGCLEIFFIGEKVNINKFMTIYENPLYFKSIDQFKIIIKDSNNDFANIPEEIYIYSKYFSNVFNCEKKEYGDIIELNIKTSKIYFHIYNLIENDLCFIKINDNYLVGRLIY